MISIAIFHFFPKILFELVSIWSGFHLLVILPASSAGVLDMCATSRCKLKSGLISVSLVLRRLILLYVVVTEVVFTNGVLVVWRLNFGVLYALIFQPLASVPKLLSGNRVCRTLAIWLTSRLFSLGLPRCESSLLKWKFVSSCALVISDLRFGWLIMII